MKPKAHEYTFIRPESETTGAIKALAQHEAWDTFLSWLFAQCRKPDIDLSNPNSLAAVAHQARMNLFVAITNKMKEPTEVANNERNSRNR